MTDTAKKVSGLVLVLLAVMDHVADSLRRMAPFRRLGMRTRSGLLMEFLLYNLHQFDRTLFAWLGGQERDALMDGMLLELSACLAKDNAEDLRRVCQELHLDTIWKSVQHPSFQAALKDLLPSYERRQSEYANYFERPPEGAGLAGTLVWEFGKKIARSMGREGDLEIIAMSQVIGTAWTQSADSMKRVLSGDQLSM